MWASSRWSTRTQATEATAPTRARRPICELMSVLSTNAPHTKWTASDAQIHLAMLNVWMYQGYR